MHTGHEIRNTLLQIKIKYVGIYQPGTVNGPGIGSKRTAMANNKKINVGKRKNNGGLPGVGRKPAIDKKILVGIYLLSSKVEQLGGKDAVREIFYTAITNK